MNTKYSIKDNLTIVIPTYNEGKYIDSTITSIYRQTGIVGTRVIVADNNSTDNTRQRVNYLSNLFSKKLKIEIIDGGLVGVARNNGAKISNTKYILFIDGDVILRDTDTIQRSLDEVVKNDYHLLTCKLYCHEGNWKAKLSFRLFNLINQIISLKTPFAVGTFFLTDREVFVSHGSFDETLNHSEDYCLSKKYNPRDFKILNRYVGQDDRRFKKMGYLGMIKLLIKGFLNQNNPQFFKKDVGYWN
jgi:glycosyltransferase involved in cell wall biosynthesis